LERKRFRNEAPDRINDSWRSRKSDEMVLEDEYKHPINNASVWLEDKPRDWSK